MPPLVPAPLTALQHALYRRLLRASSNLDAQLLRHPPLLQRELPSLIQAVPSSLAAPPHAPSSSVALTQSLARTSAGTPAALDDALALLRHVRHRAAALAPLVYAPSSECVTRGVRVRTTAVPRGYAAGAWSFAYDVEVLNESAQSVRLMARRWEILDADGNVETVDGLGVVGEYPEVAPGGVYRYSSFAPLRTRVGAMRGRFFFLVGEGEDRSVLEAVIAPFGLVDERGGAGGEIGEARSGAAFGGMSSSKLRGAGAGGDAFFPKGRRTRRPKDDRKRPEAT